jgi:transcriptional regulator with XRE-family HTH domain
MDSQRKQTTTTPAQRFAAWLRGAMRRAGLDIDSRMGGGRAELADSLGVSRSTVSRWLAGDSLPDPTQFESIAAAVGVPVLELLVGSGIISARAAEQADPVSVQTRPLSPEEALADLGITDPQDQALFLAMVERLNAHRAE